MRVRVSSVGRVAGAAQFAAELVALAVLQLSHCSSIAAASLVAASNVGVELSLSLELLLLLLLLWLALALARPASTFAFQHAKFSLQKYTHSQSVLFPISLHFVVVFFTSRRISSSLLLVSQRQTHTESQIHIHIQTQRERHTNVELDSSKTSSNRYCEQSLAAPSKQI